jgi:hypothetical protein
LFSGIKRALACGERLRFMTLTSAPWSSILELARHFNILTKRIRRKFGKFDYWRILTNEGFGVLHVVYRGSYIPQAWLSMAWAEIHGAPIVDIREIKDTPKRVARYVVGHYLSHQTFERMSYSWRWVFKGFVTYWKRLLSFFSFKEAKCSWDWILVNGLPSFKQLTLGGG